MYYRVERSDKMSQTRYSSFDKVAIIADVVNSKDIKERNDFQLKLKILLESINDRFESDFASKFRISYGDEFEALLHGADHVLLIIDEINLSLYPIKVRWGIGVGEMATTSSILSYRELDGSSYRNARQALEHVKKHNYYGNSLCRLQTLSKNTMVEDFVNSMFQLQDSIRLSWTFDQSNIVQYLIKDYNYHSFVQKAVAETLDLSQQRISNVLAATSYKQYAQSRKLTTKLLKELVRSIESH